MALSEHEQRQLDELEAALAADDPRLAHTLRGTVQRRVHPRRASMAAVGFVAGLAGLIGGLQLHPVVSILGFVVMLLSAVFGLGAWPSHGSDPSRISPTHPSRQSVTLPKTDPRRRDEQA